MPKVEIVTPRPDDFKPGESVAGYGTQVFVDGRELTEVRSCRMQWTIEDVVTCDLEVLPSMGSRFVADAHLNLSVIAMPGHVVIAEPQLDGTTVYRVEEAPVSSVEMPWLARVLDWFRGGRRESGA
jgi:hypothetical protein